MLRLRRPRPIQASSNATTSYQIPVKWEMQYTLNVSANSLKEAIDAVNRCDYDLPAGEYVPEAYEIDFGALEE